MLCRENTRNLRIVDAGLKSSQASNPLYARRRFGVQLTQFVVYSP